MRNESLVLEFITTVEQHFNFIFQYLIVVGLLNILPDGSDVPPASISAVVSRPPTFVQEVRDQPVPQG